MTQPSTHPSAPSVFISSTVYDLKDLRSALAYVLRSQGVVVYASEAAEFEIQGDLPALDECLGKIRASDFYVLIIGGRKDSTLEDGNSVTRHEYQAARESFLANGRPKLWMYVRVEVENALGGDTYAQSEDRIDDPKHLTSFLDEIRHPPEPTVPNWLSPFREASDVIESTLANLNFGRNFWESVVRHSLVTELSANLALVTNRVKSTAVPAHRFMESVRKKYGETELSESDENIVLDSQDRTRLVLALVPTKPFVNLRDDAVMQAINGGVFLAVDPTTGALFETPMHQELTRVLIDIQIMKRVEISIGESLNRLAADLMPPSAYVSSDYCEVRKSDLVVSFSLFDRLEDLFNGHVAICSALTMGNSDPDSYERSPLTPVSALESAQIRAERVSPAEIQHLITNQISPFGQRVMADTFGSTEEEQVQNLMKSNLEYLKTNYPDANIPPEIMESSAREFLRKFSPAPEEGLENLGSPIRDSRRGNK